jgi:antitoxin component YwqK of YwqJK toxin-antitoxin module
MRNLLALLVVTLACAHPSNAQSKTGREVAGLVGPVHTVRVETARVSNVSGRFVEGERVLTQLSSFDEKGNATGQSVFDTDGSPRWKLAWGHTYDAKGRETETTYINARGTLTCRAVSVYDGQGRKVEMTFYCPGGAVNHVETFAYDEGGRMIREAHLNPDGTLRNSSASTYDADGRLIESSLNKPDGTLSQRNVHTYDERGREAEWVIYREDGTPAIGQRYDYDESGNVAESLRYGNGVLLSRETFTYEFDARGNWVKRRVVRETTKGDTSRTEMEVNYRTIAYY